MAVILDSFSFMEFPLSISRQDGFPLDRYSVFDSLEAAQTYAQTNPVAYVGQRIAVVADGVATQYSIKNTAGELEAITGGGGGGTGNVSSPDISNIAAIDQATYDELEVKDPNTLYLIRG